MFNNIDLSNKIELMSEIGKWIELKYLDWQVKQGSRSTVEEFAEYLDLSQPYLSQIMNGKRKSISMQTALKIAELFGDYTILDILGYSRPPESELYKLLPGLKERIDRAVSEVLSVYETSGVTDPTSPEAREIAIRILAKHGFAEKETDNS